MTDELGFLRVLIPTAPRERISDAYAELKGLPTQELAELHRFARVSQIGASTRIENAVMTDPEVDWIDTLHEGDGKKTAFEAHRHIIEDRFSKDRERSIEEVAGCRSMLLLIYGQAKELFPLTETTLRGLHAELMRHHPPAQDFAGDYKETPNAVVERNPAQDRVLFQPAEPGAETKTAMTDLVAW